LVIAFPDENHADRLAALKLLVTKLPICAEYDVERVMKVVKLFGAGSWVIHAANVLGPFAGVQKTQQQQQQREWPEKEPNYTLECVICIKRERNTILQDCRHVILCDVCILTLGAQFPCPLCRRTNSSFALAHL
jgi:hypothetical protein